MVNLLIIRLSALGDVAMLVPVVKVLASQHPDIKVTVLSAKFLQPLFEGISDNVRFIAFDKKGEHKGFAGLNRLFRQLQAENFTHIADCHDVLRTKYLRLRFRFSNLFGKKPVIAHIDKHREGKRALVREENKQLVQQPTSFENYAETIDKVLGTEINAECRIQNAEFKRIQNAEFRMQNWNNSEFRMQNSELSGAADDSAFCIQHSALKIGIAPFAAHPGKIYPLDKMREVVRQLLARGCKIYLFGAGEKEMSVFHEWQREFGGNAEFRMQNSELENNAECRMQNSELSGAADDSAFCIQHSASQLTIASDVLKSEGRKGIGEEVKLMGELDAMLTMDSGNQHLAALSGTRVVSVWGATHPLAGFLAWQQSAADCVQLDMPCRPCSIYGNKPCKHGDYPCLQNISPEEIVNKLIDN
ncbi:MAG: glycosyltransferase family 9 protein [Bacteroidaceae bacterium]|nr:glycosyltransferase family 9 protein [Bacteroidaceae bacterium]